MRIKQKTQDGLVMRTYHNFIGIEQPALVGAGSVTWLHRHAVARTLWHHTQRLLPDQPQPGVAKVLVLNQAREGGY